MVVVVANKVVGEFVSQQSATPRGNSVVCIVVVIPVAEILRMLFVLLSATYTVRSSATSSWYGALYLADVPTPSTEPKVPAKPDNAATYHDAPNAPVASAAGVA